MGHYSRRRMVIIGGFPRSGTTLLRNLLASHPEFAVTMEFYNFVGLGDNTLAYSRRILRHWWNNRTRSFLVQGKDEGKPGYVVKSHAFVARYLVEINRQRSEPVSVSTIERALQKTFPSKRVFGDKFPWYVFDLDNLVKIEGLVPIIIYRDCRDVTSSFLAQVHGKWRGMLFVKELDSAAKIVPKWVSAIENMERHRDKLHVIRYRDLIQNTENELMALAGLLNVDVRGFPKEMVRSDRLGKHQEGLTDKERAIVMDIAGPTMKRLGYV